MSPLIVLDEESRHRELASFNQGRLRPSLTIFDEIPDETWAHALELDVVESHRARVRARALSAPTEAAAFVRWFGSLEKSGPGQHDPLFDYVESAATLDEVRWVLSQEVAGEAGFEDLIALTQLRMPTRVKLELARNYWDEMGQGHERGMHGPMLQQLANELWIEESSTEIIWESLALANLMTAFAMCRRYAFQSIGALGVVELTAPGRAVKMDAALKRLGVSGAARRYYALHARLDVKHSAAWNQEILFPLVDAHPMLAQPIAEGALMRLEAGARCYERCRAELQIQRSQSQPSQIEPRQSA